MKKNEKDNLIIKPPVVVVLGHIDHGKSSLLEAIRKEITITAREAGGITQHIGAYEIEHQGKKITFIDTPGHEAFSAMRLRGAKVADIAVLVVDASEGVKTQTKEAIKAVEEASIPLIVALNKIDKPQCQPEWVVGELKKEGVVVEALGGKVPAVKTSAKTGEGIDELLETILLIAEMEKLETSLSAPAEGVIIESAKDNKKGTLVSILLRQGIVKLGDVLGTSSACGKVKKITDCWGKSLDKALPAQPIQVLGFAGLPKAGEIVKVFHNLKTAKEYLQSGAASKEEFLQKEEMGAKGEEEKILKIILKADVKGSLEAVESILAAIPQEEVKLKVIKAEVGPIGVSDIQLAESSGARIFGFRVKVDSAAENFSQQKKIFPKVFDVIYKLKEEVEKLLNKLLGPEKRRVDLGKIKTLVVFKKERKEQIIGGRVIEGEIANNVFAEVFRQEEVIGEGRIKSIQENKKNIVSAGKGKEIGMLFLGDVDIQEGDILKVFKEELVKKDI